MLQDEVRARIQDEISDSEVEVVLDGNRATIRIVSAKFDGLSSVRRQQLVYGCINHWIQSGAIHAVTMETLAPSEV